MLGGSWLRFPWVDRRGIDQNSVKLLNYCLIICIMLNWVGARLLIRKRMNSHNFLLFKRQWLMIIQLIFDSGFQFGDVEKIISPNFLVIQSWSCWWIKITWEAAGFSPLRKDGVLTYQVPRRRRFVAFFFPEFWVHPWKTNMEPENGSLEKEKHLQITRFGVPCLFSREYGSTVFVGSTPIDSFSDNKRGPILTNLTTSTGK